MATKVSPYKLNRILSLYFSGLNQSQIAQRLNIDQSTVSLYIAEFNRDTLEKGFTNAAEEVYIMDTVYALHSLSAELKASGLTAEEARAGLKVMNKLKQCGVGDECYPELVQAAAEMHGQGFMESAMKLVSLENDTGMSYQQVIGKFEEVTNQMKVKSRELASLHSEISTITAELMSLKNKKKAAERELHDYLQETGMSMKRLVAVEKLALLLKNAGVADERLDEYIKRQQSVDQSGISIHLLEAITSKTGGIVAKYGAKHLLGMVTEYGGLEGAIQKLNDQIASLKGQAADLAQKVEEKNNLTKEINKLQAQKTNLRGSVKELFEKDNKLKQINQEIISNKDIKRNLELAIKSLSEQKMSLENEVEKIESKRTGLEPLGKKHDELSEKVDGVERELREKNKLVELFEAFLGFLRNITPEALDKFVSLAPEMVSWAKAGKYSADLIKRIILSDITMGQLNCYVCTTCDTRFYVSSTPMWKEKYSCPGCGIGLTVEVEKDAYTRLKTIATNIDVSKGTTPVRYIPVRRQNNST